MNKKEIEVLYNQFRLLDGWSKEEILFSIESLQRKRDAQNKFTFTSITLSASLATLITSISISPDIAGLGASALVAGASGFAFTGLAGVGASTLLPIVAKQLRRHSTYIEDTLGDVISKKEGLPRSLVFSRTIASGDKEAIANLALEKHKEVIRITNKIKKGNPKKSEDYFYIEVKYKATNITKEDKQFFNNAYQSLEKNFSSNIIHENEELRQSISKAIARSSDGILSKSAISNAYMVARRDHRDAPDSFDL